MTDAPTNKGSLRKVPIAWEALEDAFENNANDIRSYLHLESGDVLRLVDGVADPAVSSRVVSDPLSLHVDPVSSREQYRWMERVIDTVEDGDFRDKLQRAIDGKGAFRRFKDVLVSFPVDRERWFQFRSERLKACMEAWLDAHRIAAVPREDWRVPSADEVKIKVEPQADSGRGSRVDVVDELRTKLRDLVEMLPTRDLDTAIAYMEFLRNRRPSSPAAAPVAAVADAEPVVEGSREVKLPDAPTDAEKPRADRGKS